MRERAKAPRSSPLAPSLIESRDGSRFADRTDSSARLPRSAHSSGMRGQSGAVRNVPRTLTINGIPNEVQGHGRRAVRGARRARPSTATATRSTPSCAC
eukprot:7005091-Prymnesium_polylepis.1